MSDLSRFVSAQERVHDTALAELRAGRKTSHWMWFVFPQIAGLGQSETARHYAIRDADEARAYLAHRILGRRLATCVEALIMHRGRSAGSIFGGIDSVKLRSSLTLFEYVADASTRPLFATCLDVFFDGERDPETLVRL